MKYLIYCADELWSSLSGFKEFIESKTDHVIFNPELSEISFSGHDRKALIIFVSDNLLKSALIGRVLQLDINSFDFFIPVISWGSVLKNGIPFKVETRISSLHELMQYRDYWYEEWIRLRKLNAEVSGTVSENIIEQTRKISSEITPFLKKLALHKPIDFLNFEKDNFNFLTQKFGLSAKEMKTELSEFIKEKINDEDFIDHNDHNRIFEEAQSIENNITNSFESPVIITDTAPSSESTLIYSETIIDNMKDENHTALTTEQLMESASIAQDEENFIEARNCYEKILKIEPMHGKALRDLAVLIDSHYENEPAEELFRKALFCHEEDAALYFEYAQHLSKNPQMLHKAADMYQRSIELDETNAKSYLELAHCLLKSGQKISAKANYLQACIIDPDSRSAESDSLFAVYNPIPMSVKEEQIPEIIKNPNEDTVVMVTGATSGIGKAIAEIFASNGYKVILTGRRIDRLEQIKEEYQQKFSAQIESLSFDIRSEEEVHLAINQLPENWKNIDILINNAGLAKGRATIHLGNLNHWETMIDTNIKGLLYITRLVSQNMVERQKGFIVNIGSIAGKEAYTDGNVYCATKAAVDMLTKGIRLDLHKFGIRVAAVHPGHVETEFALVRFDGDEEKANIYNNFTPLTASDVAETVYYIVNRPAHVNIQDVLMFSTQQASATVVDMSGKKYKN